MLSQFGISTPEQIMASDLSLEDKLARILSKRYFSREQKLKCVRQLLHFGVDIRTRNHVLLRWAAEHGFADIVAEVLAKGANIHVLGGEPLIRAAMNNHFEVVEVLLQYGADHRKKDYAAFRMCAAVGNLAMMERLLQQRTDVAVKNNFALKKAYFHQQTDIVDYLMMRYADAIKHQAKQTDDQWVLDFCESYQTNHDVIPSKEALQSRPHGVSIH